MTLYVFDMDGTITPARLPMTQEFALKFHQFQQVNKTFIATGSDLKKVQEQLPETVVYGFTGIYCSMGNSLWAKGDYVYQKPFVSNPLLKEKLEGYRKNTLYPNALFPNYIEERTGMVNFSVLGRDCPYTERERYCAWDKKTKERFKIREELLALFPEYDIAVGGSISIDITPKGCGKEQVATHLRALYPDEETIFFGDRTFEGGNDYELAEALKTLENTQVVQVDIPEDVLKFLKIGEI